MCMYVYVLCICMMYVISLFIGYTTLTRIRGQGIVQEFSAHIYIYIYIYIYHDLCQLQSVFVVIIVIRCEDKQCKFVQLMLC